MMAGNDSDNTTELDRIVALYQGDTFADDSEPDESDNGVTIGACSDEHPSYKRGRYVSCALTKTMSILTPLWHAFMSQVFNADHVDVLTLIQDFTNTEYLDTMYLSLERILHFLTFTESPEEVQAVIIGPGAKYRGYCGLSLAFESGNKGCNSSLYQTLANTLSADTVGVQDVNLWARQKVLLLPTELMRKNNGTCVMWDEALVRFITMLLRRRPRLCVWCASTHATRLMTRIASSVKSGATIIHAPVENVTRVQPNPFNIINSHLERPLSWSHGYVAEH